MSSLERCPRCEAELPVDAPGGLCPKCLVQAGLKSSSPAEQPTVRSSDSSGFVPPDPGELSQAFPQLEILGLLGHGGMGAVYKARQPALDRTVALKILPAEVARDPAFADRFSREARALARLNHPNVVGIYESGVAQGLYYFVMEYVDGVNLRQALHDGGVTAEQALTIVPQVCEALQYAHDQGIVHRDIKPENILLDRSGRVKIADFGLAKLLAQDVPEPELTAVHQVMGTPRYMAPEQMLGARSVDHRADIYSLGVVFYELLTGEVPLGRFEPPSHRVQVDVRLDEIVLRSLAREPAQRYQRASQVKTEVEAVSKDPGPVASPDTVPDAIVFRRLSVIVLLIWLGWSALLGGLHWGYLAGAVWYFKKELPFEYLRDFSGLAFLIQVYFLGYWWYLLAKSPDSRRSWQDALRLLGTADPRMRKLWLPAVSYLLIWMIAMVLTTIAFNDNVQSTTLTALFVAAPLVLMASCLWAFRERAADLLRRTDSLA